MACCVRVGPGQVTSTPHRSVSASRVHSLSVFRRALAEAGPLKSRTLCFVLTLHMQRTSVCFRLWQAAVQGGTQPSKSLAMKLGVRSVLKWFSRPARCSWSLQRARKMGGQWWTFNSQCPLALRFEASSRRPLRWSSVVVVVVVVALLLLCRCGGRF